MFSKQRLKAIISSQRRARRLSYCLVPARGGRVGGWRLGVLLFAVLGGGVLPARGSGSMDKPTVLVVVGAAGEEEFGKEFEKWAGFWERAAAKAGAKHVVIGL